MSGGVGDRAPWVSECRGQAFQVVAYSLHFTSLLPNFTSLDDSRSSLD